MFRALSMIRRLTRAARVLGAHGVLPPPEWADLAPPQLQTAQAGFSADRKPRCTAVPANVSRAR